MDCENCSNKKAPDCVPYPVYEIIMAQNERTVKRLWITILILIVLFIGCNGMWAWREAQYEDVVVTQEVVQETDTGGNNNFVGGYDYGEANGQDND